VALVGRVTIAAATLANVLVYLLGDRLIGYDPDFVVLATVGGTISFTVFFALAAVLVYAGVLTLARNPARDFTIISAVVFIVTLIPDLIYIPTVEGSSTAQTAILMLMHVVAAAIIVPMLTILACPER